MASICTRRCSILYFMYVHVICNVTYVSLPSSRSVLMRLLHNFHKRFHGGFTFGKDVLRSLCSLLSWITLYNPSSYQRQQQLEVTEVTHLANMAHNMGIGIVSHIIIYYLHVTSCYIMLHHVTSCYIMLHHVTSCYIMLSRDQKKKRNRFSMFGPLCNLNS